MSDTTDWLSEAQQRSWRTFLRLHRKLNARMAGDLQAHANLSVADFEVLVALTDVAEGRLRFQDLSEAIEWERSRLSHQVARMIKRDLVAREDCPEDGRGAFVVITAHGRDVIEAAAPKHVVMVRKLFIDAITPEELAVLGRICERVLDHMDDVPS